MTKAKLISISILVSLALIVVLQNTDPVRTNFLFFSATMPRASLLAITLLVGIIVGVLLTIGFTGKKKPND